MEDKDLERKLMTISATEYCEMKGKKLSDYTAFGIIAPWNGVKLRVTAEVEAVVGLRIEDSILPAVYGTALVPKKNNKKGGK